MEYKSRAPEQQKEQSLDRVKENISQRARELMSSFIKERNILKLKTDVTKFISSYESTIASGFTEKFAVAQQLRRSEKSISVMLHEFSSMFKDDLNFLEVRNYLQDAMDSKRLEMNTLALESAGQEVADVFTEIAAQYPEMKELHINIKVPKQGQTLSHTGGYFVQPSSWGYDHPTIVVTPEDLSHYEKLLQSRKDSVEVVAELLGIAPEQMIPKILQQFIFAHEVGHAHDYINNYLAEGEPEEAAKQWDQISAAQMGRLPLPNVNPARLNNLRESGDLEGLVRNSATPYLSDTGIDYERLIKDQNRAYRSLPKEQYADNFAVQFLKKRLG